MKVSSKSKYLEQVKLSIKYEVQTEEILYHQFLIMRKKVKDKDMILKERMEREMMKSLLEVSPEEEMEDEILRRQQRMVSDQIKKCQENEQIKLQKLRIRFLKVENFN